MSKMYIIIIKFWKYDSYYLIGSDNVAFFIQNPLRDTFQCIIIGTLWIVTFCKVYIHFENGERSVLALK